MVVIPETNTPGQADDDAYFDEMFISFFSLWKHKSLSNPAATFQQKSVRANLDNVIQTHIITHNLRSAQPDFYFSRLQKNDDSLVPKDGHKIACTMAAVEMIFSWATWYGFNLDW